MDQRAGIPVTLPRANPTQSYWQDPPDDIADLRTTPDLPERADIVIIGSGITGAAVAWNLLQGNGGSSSSSRPSIVMLEARQACSGATGRNGGHTKAASYRSFLANAAALGTAAAAKIARLELANINAMHSFAREHAIPCDSNPCETVDVIYDEPHWQEAHAAVEAMRHALGPEDPAAQYAFHDREETKARFYCAGTEPVGAVSYAAGSISGYGFGVGVLKLALREGISLQTNTPAVDLSQCSDGSGRWEVSTPRGRIVADRVVLATNGYSAHLWKAFQGAIVPLRGQVTAQRPGSNMPSGGLPTTYSFIYENGYEYMIPRPPGTKHAGDIVIGGGLVKAAQEGLFEYGTTDDTVLDEDISAYLRDTTARRFGRKNWGEDHADGRVRAEWTGVMGYSPDGFPFVGELPGSSGGGLWASCSFQGHGMVLCWMCARAVVQMMRGGGGGGDLGGWFPEAFVVSEERLAKRFRGRLHTSAAAAADTPAAVGDDQQQA
ncbi:hypothetical protein Daus18300_001096 [Diaporthe australafricana]|uniref:FAD dependent oxidoreductase domain-containing protein n=1 Tax=Diaporthe australafricana TaxID=127596 RepID=A0ABR3XZ53_9PEZI